MLQCMGIIGKNKKTPKTQMAAISLSYTGWVSGIARVKPPSAEAVLFSNPIAHLPQYRTVHWPIGYCVTDFKHKRLISRPRVVSNHRVLTGQCKVFAYDVQNQVGSIGNAVGPKNKEVCRVETQILSSTIQNIAYPSNFTVRTHLTIPISDNRPCW